ncbi:MAG TPA: LytTR family DNA-binding domain-containing protein [Balneolaceae bacterium]|nr:LytTR family DNA-binding domain-containing protein [Balneolaceae bacterium]
MKCIIIEDELPAQRVLKKYIADIPYLDLVNTFKSPVEAMETLQSKSVDVLFLDINLPKISGLNFLRSLRNPPQVIITTAYPDYAHEGFELNVVDYLLKPFSFDRFLKALSKIQTTKNNSSGHPSSGNRFVFVKVDKVLHKVDFEDILYIESDKDYVNIVKTDGSLMLLQTLKYWQDLLPDRDFARVHKSFIVNISKIKKIAGNQIEIADRFIPVGRAFKQDFLEKIKTIS